MVLAEIISFLQSTKKNYINYCIVGKQEQAFFLLSRIGLSAWPCKSDLFVSALYVVRSDFFCKLQMSFFDTTYCYYIRGINELSENERKEWFIFFKNYHGPHKIVIILLNDFLILNQSNKITFPELITVSDFLFLADKFNKPVKKSHLIEFIQEAFPFKKELSFNAAMIAFLYIRVTSGLMIDSFCKQYMSLLLVQDNSLFHLAEAFFLKEKSFFKIWYHLFPHYSVQFWISFWLEQILKATMYYFYKKNNMHDVAKKISFRIPFSIINGGWKKLNIKKLQKLHSDLFYFDCNIKSGVSENNIHTILNNAFFEIR